MSDRITTGLIAVFTTVMVVVSCQGSETSPRDGNKKPSENAAQASPSPSPGTPGTADPAATTSSCEDQWKKHVAYFKVGSQLTYAAKVSSTSPLMVQPVSAQHTEVVTVSSDTQVDRKVTITSNDTFVAMLLATLKLPEKISLTKANFVKMCEKSEGKATNTVTFAGGDAQVLENRAETITLAGKSVQTQFMKIKSNISSGGYAIVANVQVWMSTEVPGLVLKQVSDLTGVPFVNTVSITDELTGSSGF